MKEKEMDVFTCRYQEFRQGMGAPIRTTLGHPRFKLGYDLAGTLMEVAPSRAIFKLPNPQFVAGYEELCNAYGAERFWSLFQATSARLGGQDLVLLCFCDLTKADACCHRRCFADWFQRETEYEIKELGRTRNADELDRDVLFH